MTDSRDTAEALAARLTTRSLGITLDDLDQPILLEEEVPMLRLIFGAMASFDQGEGDDILRATSSALMLLTETIVSSFVGDVEKRLDRDVDISGVDRALITETMSEEFDAGGAHPRARMVSGHVAARQGDYYGPIVNLAARLVDEAVPGELLATADMRDTISSTAFRVEPAGRRMLKGFADPIAVVSVHRKDVA